MASVSEAPARHRLRLELWSWSSWLVLAIVSYPALLLIRFSPVAGLLAGVSTGLLVAFSASRGYSARAGIDQRRAAALVAAAGIAVGAVALTFDHASPQSALLAGAIASTLASFAWVFLPWLVHDADSVDTAATSVHPPTPAHTGQPAPRAALGIVLMLALLALGLGAAWSRGEARAPSPAGWIAVVGLLCLAFMFVERLAFFERASREGNLLMAPGSYRGWLGAATLVALISAALASMVPWTRAKEAQEPSRAGSAPAASAMQSAGQRLGESAERLSQAARDAASQAAAGASATSAALSALALLLLLLLLALALVWAAKRMGLIRWLTDSAKALAALMVRVWRRFVGIMGSAPASASAPGQAGPSADPLLDIFAQPDLLAGLSAREIVIRTYHLLLNSADMLGHGRRRSQTPFEYALALAQSAPDAAESVRALTWAYSGAMYGGESATWPDPSSIRDSWQRVSSALTAGMTEEELALRKSAYLAERSVRGRT